MQQPGPNGFMNSQMYKARGKELIRNWNTQDRKVNNELFECFLSAAVRLPQIN